MKHCFTNRFLVYYNNKKIILTLCFIITACLLHAQVLYGTTFYGGANNGGAIVKLVTATNTLTAAFSLESSDGVNPVSAPIQASDGKLYGMTSDGGSNSSGVIFSYDPSTSTYTKLKDFDYTNGGYPYGSLIQASDGKLYGMTSDGGSNKSGVIFSYDPSTSTYTKLKDFDYTNGGSPYGSLIQASDGKLYGMTSEGGSNDYGVIFSYDPSTSIYAKLKDFDYTNGGYPFGSLIEASDGKLYGMTSDGGSNSSGVIFSYDPSTSIYTKLKDFDYTNAGSPYGSLIQASDGKLYGMTSEGGSNHYGVIFSYDPSTSTYAKLKDFDYTNGGYPQGSLIEASDGKLYGVTSTGGSNDHGVIFSYDPVTSTYTKLKDFDYTNGGSPQGSLIQASDGKLYGITYAGGNSKVGIIFSYDPTISVFLNLSSFGENNTGIGLPGSLIHAFDGKLYGVTSSGGSNGYGIIFSYNASTSTYTKLKDFDLANGVNPLGSLMQASDGELYGMTNAGGSNDYGVIFSYDPVTSAYTKLKDFDGTNGGSPQGSLMQASDGKLYGMTYAGGSNGVGIIFSYDASTSTYAKLKDFDGTNGASPRGSLMQASDGKLYGMTSDGGSNKSGVIFSYDPSTSTYTKLKDFDYTNGGSPYGSLIQASDGKLYGMTSEGGSNDYGVIFSYDAPTSAYSKLKDFNYSIGIFPRGSLMQASDGKLYGMTQGGGSNNGGVSFSYDPSTSTFTKLADFNGSNGWYPQGTSFIELCAKEITYYKDADGDGYGNAADSAQSCVPLIGYVTDNTDCNDSSASVHPAAEEICGNGIDDNCNGAIDEGCTGVHISIADNSVIEGDHGVKLMRFKVSLSSKSPKKVIVRYNTQSGTATAGSDYVAQNGIIVFPPGLTNIISGILIKGDKITEANETFNIILHNPVNATVADSIGTFTIADNDGALIAAATKDANTLNVMKSVKLSPNPAQGKVNLMLTGYSGDIIIKLNSADGRTLQERKMQASSLKPLQQQFDVSRYADGMYFITVIDAKGAGRTEKLVIDR